MNAQAKINSPAAREIGSNCGRTPVYKTSIAVTTIAQR
jgi:hypothetical protein